MVRPRDDEEVPIYTQILPSFYITPAASTVGTFLPRSSPRRRPWRVSYLDLSYYHLALSCVSDTEHGAADYDLHSVHPATPNSGDTDDNLACLYVLTGPCALVGVSQPLSLTCRLPTTVPGLASDQRHRPSPTSLLRPRPKNVLVHAPSRRRLLVSLHCPISAAVQATL